LKFGVKDFEFSCILCAIVFVVVIFPIHNSDL